MTDGTLLLLLLLLPALAAAVVHFIRPEGSRGFALGASVIQLLATVFLFQGQALSENGWLELSYDWVPDLGIHFHLGVDGIGILLLALTNVLVPLIVLSSHRNNHHRPNALFGLILLMQAALNGVFMAMDGFLFYVFWELALLPIWFICLLWGGADRVRITLKFFIYTLSGSLLMLLGLIMVYLQTPAPHSFDLNALYRCSGRKRPGLVVLDVLPCLRHQDPGVSFPHLATGYVHRCSTARFDVVIGHHAEDGYLRHHPLDASDSSRWHR